MFIPHADSAFRVPPGTLPNYNENNPLLSVVRMIEGISLAAEREVYLGEHLQYLFPIKQLELYGPSAPNTDILDPRQQDFKTDFQKQNVRTFLTADTQLMRGYVALDGQVFPFLRLSYRGGPDTILSRAAGGRLGDRIKLYLKIGDQGGALLNVPYNEATDRYDVELWGYGGDSLRPLLDVKGRDALERGVIQARPDLVQGRAADFDRDRINGALIISVTPRHAMHPILPLHLELAWADREERAWDSNDGKNHHYEFNMIVRGWESFLEAGMSPNPHGGVGFLEYRNLMSNYFSHAARPELGRKLESFNLNAFGEKNPPRLEENFMAVEYMDLHLLRGDSGIGLHRHRDNQEIFLMMHGQGLMVVGDWCEFPQRERCIEARTLRPGHLAMLKGGNLHGLMNPTDEELHLFMFGGYD